MVKKDFNILSFKLSFPKKVHNLFAIGLFQQQQKLKIIRIIILSTTSSSWP